MIKEFNFYRDYECSGEGKLFAVDQNDREFSIGYFRNDDEEKVKNIILKYPDIENVLILNYEDNFVDSIPPNLMDEISLFMI